MIQLLFGVPPSLMNSGLLVLTVLLLTSEWNSIQTEKGTESKPQKNKKQKRFLLPQESNPFVVRWNFEQWGGFFSLRWKIKGKSVNKGSNDASVWILFTPIAVLSYNLWINDSAPVNTLCFSLILNMTMFEVFWFYRRRQTKLFDIWFVCSPATKHREGCSNRKLNSGRRLLPCELGYNVRLQTITWGVSGQPQDIFNEVSWLHGQLKQITTVLQMAYRFENRKKKENNSLLSSKPIFFFTFTTLTLYPVFGHQRVFFTFGCWRSECS